MIVYKLGKFSYKTFPIPSLNISLLPSFHHETKSTASVRDKATTPSGVWKLKPPQDLESLILFPLGTAGFPGGSAGKKIHVQCGRPGFDPWVRKIFPGGGKGHPLQYSCLEDSTDMESQRVRYNQVTFSFSFLVQWIRKLTTQRRGQGFHSWSPKISHVMEQQNPCICWTLLALEPVPHNQRSHRNANHSHRNHRLAPARSN